jgi:hypothetical protein
MACSHKGGRSCWQNAFTPHRRVGLVGFLAELPQPEKCTSYTSPFNLAASRFLVTFGLLFAVHEAREDKLVLESESLASCRRSMGRPPKFPSRLSLLA